MGDELARRVEQEQVLVSAASPEQVDLGKALYKVSKTIPGFVARIVPGDVQAQEWLTLGQLLEALGAECRRIGERQGQVVEADDASDEQAGE